MFGIFFFVFYFLVKSCSFLVHGYHIVSCVVGKVFVIHHKAEAFIQDDNRLEIHSMERGISPIAVL